MCFFFHDLYALSVIFLIQSCILYKNPCRKTNLNFYKIWEISTKKMGVQSYPKASKKEKIHGNWNLHDISTCTKAICRASRSLCSKR